jgi:hypothetical protein
VLDRTSYAPKEGIGAAAIEFVPTEGRPTNAWGYSLPWSTCPAKLLGSHWEGMRVPEIRLLRSESPRPVATPAVVTEDR